MIAMRDEGQGFRVPRIRRSLDLTTLRLPEAACDVTEATLAKGLAAFKSIRAEWRKAKDREKECWRALLDQQAWNGEAAKRLYGKEQS